MTKINGPIRAQLYQIICWQLLTIIGFALVVILLQGLQKGWAVFAGGMAYWLPTLLFMWRVSAYVGARAAMRFLAAFFTGEIAKLILSAGLFLIFLKYGSMDVIYGLVGMMVAIFGFWVAAAVSLTRRGVKHERH